MAFRRKFGLRFVFLLAFGLIVVLLQMLALSRLNSQPPTSGFPWEADHGRERAREVDGASLEHVSIS